MKKIQSVRQVIAKMGLSLQEVISIPEGIPGNNLARISRFAVSGTDYEVELTELLDGRGNIEVINTNRMVGNRAKFDIAYNNGRLQVICPNGDRVDMDNVTERMYAMRHLAPEQRGNYRDAMLATQVIKAAFGTDGLPIILRLLNRKTRQAVHK